MIRFFKRVATATLRGSLGVDRATRDCLEPTFHDHQVVGFETFSYD